jgi:hypothetical protein
MLVLRTIALAAASLAAAAALPAVAGAATANPKGAGCDRLDDAACLLPFPNDAFTRADKTTGTGRRLAFKLAQMPRNAQGKPIDPAPYAAFDGFSPGSVILTKVKGLHTPAALSRTGAVGLSDISRYSAAGAPVIVLDAQTGKRWPIWVELDSNAATARDRLVEIHPARNFLAGHRYVVVLRGLKGANGKRIAAGRAFAKLRGARKPGARYASIFKTLKRAGVKKDGSLFLAWDFTVASRQSLTGRMLHIRDDAFKQLGDTTLANGALDGAAPAYTLQEKALTGDDARYAGLFAHVYEGTVTVPCYLNSAGCAPGSSFNYAKAGDFLPSQLPGNTVQAHFLCAVPATATPDNPARLSLYGHGLLGKDSEVYTNPDMPKMAAEHNIVFCATPWEGMSSADIPNAGSVLQDLSGMPTIADPLQQGMLNALFLGRLMAHPAGLSANPLLQSGGRPIVRAGQLFYDGNSQGGIEGGALTAYSPDFTRAVLGVPGINYSVLLPRSSDWDTYSKVMYPAYPDELERPLALDLAQIVWDRGESDGVAQFMTDSPLPNTPRHTVLLQVAFGDHQVTQYQADVEARTIGAGIHSPILAPGRSLQAKPSWGIPPIGAYPYTGSAIVYWDAGPQRVAPPPLENVPNRALEDPHEYPRRTPAARQQKSDFLQLPGAVTDTCGGMPCVAAPDVP